MMIKILTGLLLISTMTVFGQNHLFRLKGGINWTNVNADSDSFITSSKNRTGFSCGLT